MKAYFISGLGADQRAFHKLKLPVGYSPVYLNWITPLPAESMTAYAERLSSGIDDRESFILIGLSFGGMMAVEIAKTKKPGRLILISSVAAANELPWYFRMAGRMGIQKFVPPGFYKKATILNHFMGAGTKEDKDIVMEFVRQTDPEFIKWSIHCILTWKHEAGTSNLLHIHGSDDRLLPLRYTHADRIIRNGRHLMVLDKAAEINQILAEELAGSGN